MADFKDTHYHSIAFRAEQYPDNPTKYHIHRYNRTDPFDWARHEFHVVADVENGVYECKSKLWTHTGTVRLHKKLNFGKLCMKPTY